MRESFARPRCSAVWPAMLALCATSAFGQGPPAGGNLPPGLAERLSSAVRDGGGNDYPPLEKVTEGYEKVVSNLDGEPGLYTIWVRKKDGQMLAQLPRNYMMQKYFVALTVSSGEPFAGLQGNDLYVYWKQFDKRLALIQPNVEVRSTGDQQSKSSVKRLFTDRVLLDTPIVTIPPGGGPVIDLDQVLIGQASRFFGSSAAGGNAALATIKTAKAFPQNIEVAFEMPFSGGGGSRGPSILGGGEAPGQLKSLHYSISLVPDNTGYVPREADERIGFFVTGYNDYGKFKDDRLRTRYINRWRLEKADPTLKVSPPKQPIVFYIEHTTPIRYRKWVRDGILAWNKAFEKVGITGAIEVYQQDEATKAHMEKDPEDVRYNFVRWLNNNIGTAIGPSRAHPITGEILDADIILTDGWIRNFVKDYTERLPKIAMEGYTPETLAWLDQHPRWDPRFLFAPASQRDFLLAERAKRGVQPFGGHPMANPTTPHLYGDDESDGLSHRHSQFNGMCMAADCKSMDLALMSLHASVFADEPKKDEPKKEEDKKDEPKKEEEKKDGEKKDEAKKDGEKKDGEKKAEAPKIPMLDGIPEDFIGPLLADVVTHEVGHTLGLRHNFKASSAYTFEEMNSADFKGKKAITASVMDYNPVNINLKAVTDGKFQGDYTMIGVGPYDEWAIEYGYTLDDPKDCLKRVAEPELAYATDEDTVGPDPYARRYDFAKDPLTFSKNMLELAKWHRSRLVEKFVKDGDSWSKALKGYNMTLAFQSTALANMSRWVGGAYVHRDKKGDPKGRPPIEVVPVEQQREALGFVIDNAFKDEAWGLTPDLLARMASDRWYDSDDDVHSAMSNDPSFPVHDRIMALQGTALTSLLNPSTLRRVLDNEYYVPSDKDALTLAELMGTIKGAIWAECNGKAPEKAATARTPLISSLRRNLQREHLERLIDLSLPGIGNSAAYKPISDLASMQIRELKDQINTTLAACGDKADPYTRAHLTDAQAKIEKVLNSTLIYNAKEMGGGSAPFTIIFGDQAPAGRPE
jgi:hypothetical protein